MFIQKIIETIIGDMPTKYGLENKYVIECYTKVEKIAQKADKRTKIIDFVDEIKAIKKYYERKIVESCEK